ESSRAMLEQTRKGRRQHVHLASAPDVERVTGGYFVNRKPKRSAKASHDQAAAARLWRVSAELVGLTATAEPSLGHHERNDP
ncbi:MAG: family oxidoreductase, partial [Actinomycetia bacterium]|nr:family oxidoreductase [Actinomycetes bacterium]